VTTELSLRPTRTEDLDFVVAAERDPEVHPNITMKGREGHIGVIGSDDEDHLILDEGGEPVGYAVLRGLSRPHRSIEIQTIVITKRGRGLGRRALGLILDELFEERGAHRVWLDAVGANARALRAYESVGFVREGEMREAWLTADGSFDSIVFLSILDREWAGRE